MNLFKLSTVGLALVLTGWAACGDSSNSNPDVRGFGGAGGTVSSGGATGAGGVMGSGGATDTGGVTGSGGVTAVGGSTGMGGATGTVPDAGVDAPISATDVPADVAADADAGDSGSDGEVGYVTPSDICAGLTPTQCHLKIINFPVDPTVSALDPGANPPVPYPNCSAVH